MNKLEKGQIVKIEGLPFRLLADVEVEGDVEAIKEGGYAWAGNPQTSDGGYAGVTEVYDTSVK